MQPLISLFLLLAAAPQPVHEWSFASAEDAAAWQPNVHLADVAVANGALHARAVDWDPFFVCDGLEIPTTPWQVLVIRLRATKPGQVDLYWTGDTGGAHGGLSEERKAVFQVRGGGQWEEVAVMPFWQSAGTLRKLRLDVYNNATFDIASIRILDWAAGREASTETAWDSAALENWYATSGGRSVWSPPLELEGAGPAWASIELSAETAGSGALRWGTASAANEHRQEFDIRPGTQTCNLEMAGLPAWEDIVALGLELPNGVTLSSLRLGDTPAGPADLQLTYFGVENGVNRAGQPARVIAQLTNRGGASLGALKARLDVPDGLRVSPITVAAGPIDFEGLGRLAWDVEAAEPGDYPVTLAIEGDATLRAETTIAVTPRPDVAPAAYVPEPRPLATSIDIAAYYFPGWNSAAKWDPIQRVAPVRKPVLGWYDEANPEIVDWQIKWAVENGISVFLVDWYWVQGSQHLQHWLEAYKKSRYRDQLKIALMWANHNPPGTHSVEDWARVNSHWIAEYFPMESYYRMNGKPAVFLWDHRAIRADLGGSDAVESAFAQSQEAAMTAGFDGIHYVALHGDGDEETLHREGYHGATTYHEWGNAPAMGESVTRMRFEDLVASVPAAWREKEAASGPLEFYPVLDTGWDARPWHGHRARVIAGRTPALFKTLLTEAKRFAEEKQPPLLVLGPLNEWGEGSYIEPATEYGFAMYEAIREVFGEGDPATWPVNIAPVDVNLGPYDFPAIEPATRWSFDTGTDGWGRMMGLDELSVRDGALHAQTTSRDPAFVIPLHDLRAADFTQVRIRMQIRGGDHAPGSAQLFWSRGGTATSEATSVRFPLVTDGSMHEYIVRLADNPRWRGTITSFRFDPCSASNAMVVVEEMELMADQ